MDAIQSLFTWYFTHTHALWIFPAFGLMLLVEAVFGRRERANARDVTYNLVYLFLLLGVYAYLRPFASHAAGTLAGQLGGPYLDLRIGAQGAVLPSLTAQFLLVFIYDFFYYWHHRLQHISPAMWVTHKIHHMDENMGVTTAYKHHWTDEASRTATILLPMALLFQLEPAALLWVRFLFAWQAMFIHTNIALGLGPLRLIFTGPLLHRTHHSPLPEHRDCNFASVFPIFDLMFGTYVAPPHQAPPTGLDTGEQFRTLSRGWMYPFHEWYPMLPRARRRSPA